MPSLPSTALLPNELTLGGQQVYPYAPAPNAGNTNAIPYFTDTSGGRLGASGVVLSGTSFLGATRNVISGSGATVTLTAAQSNSIVLFDRAAGIVFTLPTPAAGLFFRFLCTVSVTSNSGTIVTAVGTQFIGGQLLAGKSATAPVQFLANGSSNTQVAMNGTTTGGLIGTCIDYYGISATLWMINGITVGSGTIATPIS